MKNIIFLKNQTHNRNNVFCVHVICHMKHSTAEHNNNSNSFPLTKFQCSTHAARRNCRSLTYILMPHANFYFKPFSTPEKAQKVKRRKRFSDQCQDVWVNILGCINRSEVDWLGANNISAESSVMLQDVTWTVLH